MHSRSPTTRTVTYVLLGLASALFVVPFIWLISTSLKPIEQATSLPPTWIPRAYIATLSGGLRTEVSLDYRVNQSGVVGTLIQGEHQGDRVFLSDEQLAKNPAALRVEYKVLPGWWHVTQRIEKKSGHDQPKWDFLPNERIESHIHLRWRNYPEALSRLDGGTDDQASLQAKHRVSFWRFLGNSLIICVFGVAGTVVSNAIIAYGFARIQWKGRDAFFALTLATMMVPFPVLMVPLYSVFKAFGWIGTLLPLWVPAWFGSAFNIFLMRQFFLGIPEELSEAARIDGCSEWRIFWRIILPLSKPVLATAALFHFLYAWNDFMGPLLYLTRKETFPLSLALQSFQSQVGGVEWHYLMAASAVTTLPVIILFFFAQKTFIRGIATTGSKS
ncbi:MAG TPA: carbohydrate ABC transporter permease [Opitutaceae bacterium]|nr:carbohydrate ABC transporter permease [Opitutaceae bacterium]